MRWAESRPNPRVQPSPPSNVVQLTPWNGANALGLRPPAEVHAGRARSILSWRGLVVALLIINAGLSIFMPGGRQLGSQEYAAVAPQAASGVGRPTTGDGSALAPWLGFRSARPRIGVGSAASVHTHDHGHAHAATRGPAAGTLGRDQHPRSLPASLAGREDAMEALAVDGTSAQPAVQAMPPPPPPASDGSQPGQRAVGQRAIDQPAIDQHTIDQPAIDQHASGVAAAAGAEHGAPDTAFPYAHGGCTTPDALAARWPDVDWAEGRADGTVGANGWNGQVPVALLPDHPSTEAVASAGAAAAPGAPVATGVAASGPAWRPTLAPPMIELSLPKWDAHTIMAAEERIVKVRRASAVDARDGQQVATLTLGVAAPPGPRAVAPQSKDADAACALHAFAITNDYYTFVCEFLRSALLNGIVPHILGFTPAASDKLFNWGLGKPLLWLRPAVAALVAATGPHTMVLLADAHDTLVLVPGATIIARFRYIQARRARAGQPPMRVLITAERSCFPIPEEDCARFPLPDVAGSPYRNLNSGGWMGEAADVLAVLDAVDAAYPEGLEAANMNDQGAMQYAYLNASSRAALGLQLDYSNQVFQAMHMSENEVRPPHPDRAWHFCNAITGGCPALLHFNGGSKGRQLPIDAGLRTTTITLGEKRDDAVVAWLDGYEVGGVNMTVREFCCAPQWTQGGAGAAFNKARAAWLGC
jgi:hypothetical protein